MMQDQIDDMKETHNEQIRKLRFVAFGQGLQKQLDFNEERKLLGCLTDCIAREDEFDTKSEEASQKSLINRYQEENIKLKG